MLAHRIKALRIARGFTQDRLARAAGLNKRTIARMEGGSPIQAETLLAVCSVLGLDVAEMEAIRLTEGTPAREIPVVASTDPSVALHLLPEALAALADYPDVICLALPNLAAWRASRRPPRGADLARNVFGERDRRRARIASVCERWWPVIGLSPLGLGIPGGALASRLLDGAAGTWCGFAWILLSFAPLLAVAEVSLMGWGDKADAVQEERLERTLYAFSDHCVREVHVGDEAITIRRFDLADRLSLERQENGGLVDYRLYTSEGALHVTAIPADSGIDAIMNRQDSGTLVRRFERPLPLAA